MGIEELMNRYYDRLNENDREICHYILENKTTCFRLSIDEFSRQCHVSKTTLFRFTKKLSLPGFSELKARLRWEAGEGKNQEGDFLGRVTDSYHKMVEDMRRRNCTPIFDTFYRAKRILVYGSGYAQARVASEFKRIFLPTGKGIYNIHGYDMVRPLTRMATPGDFVLIISLSGESPAVIELAEGLRLKQVPTLSITRMRNNRLASICTENIYINSVPLPVDYMLEYEISTAYFILIELLFLKYQHYLGERQQGRFKEPEKGDDG